MGIELLLLHGLGSRAFGSWYGLGRSSSCSFSLLAECPVSPRRCISGWRGSENGLVSWIAGALAGPSMPLLAGMPFLCRSGVLGRISFEPSLFSQDHSLPVVVVVLEEDLIPSPALLCVVVMVFECPFPDLTFLWRMMFCKTLNLSFSSISLFGREWWSWKECVEDEALSLHVGPHL